MDDKKPAVIYENRPIFIPFATYKEANRCKKELDILATIEGYATIADLYQLSYPGRWKCLYDEWHHGWSKTDVLNSEIETLKNPESGDIFYINLPLAKRISQL